MDAHLLDTCFISAFCNPGSKQFSAAQSWLATTALDAPFIAAVTLGELEFGASMVVARGGELSADTRQVLIRIRGMGGIAPVSERTVEHYARVKSAIAMTRFPTLLSSIGKKKISKPDTWIDEVTGEKLGIDENDLWICAIALERNFNLVTFDTDMNHAKAACPDLRLTLLS